MTWTSNLISLVTLQNISFTFVTLDYDASILIPRYDTFLYNFAYMRVKDTSYSYRIL